MASYRLLAAAALLAGAQIAATSPFHESFGPGWASRWKHSNDAEFSGRFATESPQELEDEALKVQIIQVPVCKHPWCSDAMCSPFH